MLKPWQTFKQLNVPIRDVNYDKPFYIHMIGDQHYGGDSFCYKTEKHWIKRWKKSFDNGESYAIQHGDLFENFRITDQIAIFHALPEKSRKTLRDAVVDVCNETIDRLKFMYKRILGVIEGNHGCWITTNVQTVDQYFSEKMKAPWGGGFAFMTLRVYLPDGKHIDIKGCATHGKGGSMVYRGTNLNNVEKINRFVPNVHFISAGHTHNPAFAPNTMLDFGWKKESRSQTTQLIRVASWRTNYNNNQEDYAVGLSPTCLDMPWLKITMRKDGKDRWFDMQYNMENKMRQVGM